MDWMEEFKHSQTQQKHWAQPKWCCKLLAITSEFTHPVSSHFDISNLASYFPSGGLNTATKAFYCLPNMWNWSLGGVKGVFSSKRPVNFFFLHNRNFHFPDIVWAFTKWASSFEMSALGDAWPRRGRKRGGLNSALFFPPASKSGMLRWSGINTKKYPGWCGLMLNDQRL